MAAKLICGMAACVLALGAQAQTYPTRALKMVVPVPTGGAIDVVARTLAQKLGFFLGQNVLVENRPGSNTLAAGEAVARSPADGYTLFMTPDTTMAQLPALVEKMAFDPVRDFAPVAAVAAGASGFIGRAANPFRGFSDMISWARSHPGKLGIGGATPAAQTAIVEFGRVANIKVVMVPYQSAGAMLQALSTGEIQVISDSLAAYIAPSKQGVVSALATTSPRRYLALPSLPTVREAGLAQLEYDPWLGLFAPAGTPAPVITRLNGDTVKSLGAADLVARLQPLGFQPTPGKPEDLAALLRRDLASWSARFKAAGVRLE